MEKPVYVVLTSITGGKDVLVENNNTKGAKFIAFTDTGDKSKTWEIRPACNHSKDRRRNCKPPKLMPHLYVDADVSLWIDSNRRLKVPINRLVKEYLKDADIAVFKHPLRDCLYKEAEIELALGKAESSIVKPELAQYRKEGYPEHNGLIETNMILRRHNKRVEAFNNDWWAHVTRYAQRDQKTFCYIAWRHPDVKINYLDAIIYEKKDNKFIGPYFDYLSHLDDRAYV